MKKLTSFLLVVLICCANGIMAQQLYFNHLSVNNGLSQGVNNCIYRDSKGFVWISSFDGLNRFDGLSCVSFRSAGNEIAGLKGTLFLNILEDKNSNLWIGSNAGLNFYNRRLDQFENFRIKSRSDDDQFYSPFYIDDKNNIWLQAGSDIIIFNPSQKTFTRTTHFFLPGSLILKPWPAKPFHPLQKIIAISNNLAVFWQGQVSNYNLNWESKRLPLPSCQVTAVLQSGNEDFWFGTSIGLFHYQNNTLLKSNNRFAGEELKNISALHMDQKGTLWAGTLQQGLFYIDTATGIIKNQYSNSVYNPYSLAGKQVHFITTDEKGDLWVSLWGKGIDFTSLNKFRFNSHVTKEEAVQAGTDNFIRSIIQVNKEFWCGTQSGGIVILDENKNIKQSIHNGIPLSIEHLYLDKNNHVWVSTFDGVYLINPRSKKIMKLPGNKSGFGIASNQYNFVSGLPDGTMLASTNAGLFIIEKLNNSYHIKRAKGVANNKDVFLTTYTDQLNQIYISRAFKGFGVYTLSGDSLLLVKEMPLDATIKCFSESSDSLLWIGSTIGLIKFSKSQLQQQQLITARDGLSNQYIYGIEAVGDHLWLSTNVGINRYNVRNGNVKIFSAADGLQSNEFNTYSYCRTSGGEILFGGVNGLNSFYPDDFKHNSYPPQLILTGLQLNDTSYTQVVNKSEISELNVDFTHNTIGFQFTVIHYANPAANTLSYLLEGFDKSWVTVASKTLIRYANLPPGNYVLKVKAFNADGIEASSIYSLPVTVRAPWYQSWLFRAMTALAFAGLMFFVVRVYINRKLEKQQSEIEKKQAVQKERNRISRDMHDDLGSGLTMIAILSEVVKKQLSKPEKAKESLEKIAVSARDLVDNLQDIIWLLNPKNDTLESLSSYIREYGLKYFEPLSVQLDFKYPDHFSNIHLSDELRRNIFLTVKESFNNIAKYAWCNKITISIHETANEILLSIADDGKGFDVNNVRLFANGLKNMQNRIEQVGGNYSILSEPGKGTQTEIKIQM